MVRRFGLSRRTFGRLDTSDGDGRVSRRLATVLCALALVVTVGQAVRVSAFFVDTATVPANTFGAAARYPTYAEAVAADKPLFHHRAGTASNSRSDRVDAVPFNGTTDHLTVPGPVVKTGASFSVSAWVYLTRTNATRTAVSKAGSANSGFALQYRAQAHRWAFTMPRADSTAATLDIAQSTVKPATNTWTHLLGVYDSTAHQLRLYVNGAAQSTTNHTSGWTATGPVEVGSARWRSARGEYWAGRVDDVRLRPAALSATEVAAGYGAARGGYHPKAYANPTSFTIECWYRPREYAVGTGPRTLLSFGAAPSGDPAIPSRVDRRVDLDHSEALAFGTTDVLRSASTTRYADGKWHHLAAVAAPATGMALYLDGTLVASRPYIASEAFTGYWRWGGDVDEVAVYPTALPGRRIAAHFHAKR